MIDSSEPEVYIEMHFPSGTCQYLIIDPTTREAAIIDSVLDYDIVGRRFSTATPEKLLRLAERKNATVTKLLETHTHGDHLTAARYIQQALVSSSKPQPRPEICISKHVKTVQSAMALKYDIDLAEMDDVFDYLFEDNE